MDLATVTSLNDPYMSEFRIFIGNLHGRVTKHQLIWRFARYGFVEACKIFRRRYAFLKFRTTGAVYRAVSRANGCCFMGARIVVRYARRFSPAPRMWMPFNTLPVIVTSEEAEQVAEFIKEWGGDNAWIDVVIYRLDSGNRAVENFVHELLLDGWMYVILPSADIPFVWFYTRFLGFSRSRMEFWEAYKAARVIYVEMIKRTHRFS